MFFRRDLYDAQRQTTPRENVFENLARSVKLLESNYIISPYNVKVMDR